MIASMRCYPVLEGTCAYLKDLYVGFASAGFCSTTAPLFAMAVSGSTTRFSSPLASMVFALFYDELNGGTIMVDSHSFVGWRSRVLNGPQRCSKVMQWLVSRTSLHEGIQGSDAAFRLLGLH